MSQSPNKSRRAEESVMARNLAAFLVAEARVEVTPDTQAVIASAYEAVLRGKTCYRHVGEPPSGKLFGPSAAPGETGDEPHLDAPLALLQLAKPEEDGTTTLIYLRSMDDAEHLFVHSLAVINQTRSEPWNVDPLADYLSPEDLSEEAREKIKFELKLNDNQVLAFTTIEYDTPEPAFSNINPWNSYMRSVCFAGLANPIPFFLEGRNRSVATIEMALPDHHEYTAQDVSRIRQEWINFGQENTVLLTTEKDVVKCKNIKGFEELPLYFLRMKIKFIAGETALLNAVNEVKK